MSSWKFKFLSMYQRKIYIYNIKKKKIFLQIIYFVTFYQTCFFYFLLTLRFVLLVSIHSFLLKRSSIVYISHIQKKQYSRKNIYLVTCYKTKTKFLPKRFFFSISIHQYFFKHLSIV